MNNDPLFQQGLAGAAARHRRNNEIKPNDPTNPVEPGPIYGPKPIQDPGAPDLGGMRGGRMPRPPYAPPVGPAVDLKRVHPGTIRVGK